VRLLLQSFPLARTLIICGWHRVGPSPSTLIDTNWSRFQSVPLSASGDLNAAAQWMARQVRALSFLFWSGKPNSNFQSRPILPLASNRLRTEGIAPIIMTAVIVSHGSGEVIRCVGVSDGKWSDSPRSRALRRSKPRLRLTPGRKLLQGSSTSALAKHEIVELLEDDRRKPSSVVIQLIEEDGLESDARAEEFTNFRQDRRPVCRGLAGDARGPRAQSPGRSTLKKSQPRGGVPFRRITSGSSPQRAAGSGRISSGKAGSLRAPAPHFPVRLVGERRRWSSCVC